jgi:hypothetical protein
MTEAWLLFDEAAIRRAAGNPQGAQSLVLPELGQAEAAPQPKKLLHEALRAASGLRGHRLAKFQAARAVHGVAQHIADFSPLRQLPAFKEVQDQVEAFVASREPG